MLRGGGGGWPKSNQSVRQTGAIDSEPSMRPLTTPWTHNPCTHLKVSTNWPGTSVLKYLFLSLKRHNQVAAWCPFLKPRPRYTVPAELEKGAEFLSNSDLRLYHALVAACDDVANYDAHGLGRHVGLLMLQIQRCIAATEYSARETAAKRLSEVMSLLTTQCKSYTSRSTGPVRYYVASAPAIESHPLTMFLSKAECPGLKDQLAAANDGGDATTREASIAKALGGMGVRRFRGTLRIQSSKGKQKTVLLCDEFPGIEILFTERGHKLRDNTPVVFSLGVKLRGVWATGLQFERGGMSPSLRSPGWHGPLFDHDM